MLAVGSLAPVSCAERPPVPERTAVAASTPPMKLEKSGERWVIVMSAPTPGYQIHEDFALAALGRYEVFVTVRTPNPQFIVPQVVVEQRLLTSAATKQPVEIFARVVEFDAEAAPGEGDAYGPVNVGP